MTVRYAENAPAAYYDNQATEHMSKAASWAGQADKADSPRLKQKYLQKAEEYRKKAIEALRNANIAAGKG